VNCVSKGP